MLFNGKYYNKPGHLGMTRAELLEKLNGGGDGGDIVTVKGALTSPTTATLDKTYSEIKQFLDDGKAVEFLIKAGQIYFTFYFDGYADDDMVFRSENISIDENYTPRRLTITEIIIYVNADDSIEAYSEGPQYVEVTPVT